MDGELGWPDLDLDGHPRVLPALRAPGHEAAGSKERAMPFMQ